MANEIKISVYYCGELITTIENDNPDFDAIAKYFVKKENINFELVEVKCENDSFDSDALKDAICDAVKDFLDMAAKEKRKYEDVLREYASRID